MAQYLLIAKRGSLTEAEINKVANELVKMGNEIISVHVCANGDVHDIILQQIYDEAPRRPAPSKSRKKFLWIF